MAGHFDDFGGDYDSGDAADDRGGEIFCGSGHLDPAVCDPGTYAALQGSVGFAVATNWDSLRTPHLFMGVLAAPDVGVAVWAARLNADLGKLLAQFRDLFYQDGGPAQAMLLHREFLSDNALRVLRDAAARAADLGRGRFTQMDLLVTLFTMPCSIVADCFERIGVPADRLTQLALDAEQATLDV